MIFQWVLVGLCLTAAAAYLVRYFWRAWHGKGGSCGCGECPAKAPNGAGDSHPH